MKRIINKEEMRREWILENWGEKALYVLGWIVFIYLGVCFLFGFFEGLTDLI